MSKNLAITLPKPGTQGNLALGEFVYWIKGQGGVGSQFTVLNDWDKGKSSNERYHLVLPAQGIDATLYEGDQILLRQGKVTVKQRKR